MTNDLFKESHQNNYFDNLVVDVNEIYKKYSLNSDMKMGNAVDNQTDVFFRRIYHNQLIPVKLRKFLRKVFRQINLDISWFNQFSAYWSSILGGRPLWGVQEFYFLMNLYRVRFQDNCIPDTIDSAVHIQAWQKPELIYQLLHLVYKESTLDYVQILKQMFHNKRKIHTFLEFGCGTAPITASFFEFFNSNRNIKVYFSDIQTLAFHYASYRFQKYASAFPILLLPGNDFLLNLNEPVDTIFCITVFEHLNKPLETAKIFHRTLTTNGLLFFDYIKTNGEGLDTAQGARERENVLDFISSNFTIIHGKVTKEQSTGLVIARKK